MNARLHNLSYPPRLELARTPTPLEQLKRIGARYGVTLYIKRDDLTGTSLSGNKIRKLEFVLADALSKEADTVLTCGGEQSNHARATAIAAAQLGLKCRLILRTGDPANPPAPTGNILLDQLSGAEIVWITPEEYRNRDEIFKREAAELRDKGRRPYIIPEGASNEIGAWGYIRATEELAANLADLPGGIEQPTTIIHAAGSGGTAAGLILGRLLSKMNTRVVSINVCDDETYFRRVIGRICENAIRTYNLDISFSRDRDIEILDGYVGRGYALAQPEELKLLYDVAQTEAIFLDPVYTGKAFFGMIRELKRNPAIFGERIVFMHTGGIFGVFPLANELAPLF